MSARTPDVALALVGARKAYGPVRALDGLDLTVAAGEWVALLGPNGAGKTTLMGAVAGLVELDGGRLTMLGETVASRGESEARHRLGYVPQEIALYPSLTARENLDVFGRLHGLGGRELSERIRWALGWTRLEERSGGLVGTFSGGMTRRLNIACGVLHRPRLVLLDEPTVGVDPQGRRRIWEMLDALRQTGVALLQSTHQIDEIESICDRVVIVDHGRRIADGTVDELLAESHKVRTVRLTLDREAVGLELANGFRVEGSEIHGTIHDVGGELRELLGRLDRAGCIVRDLRVTAPGLEEVFTHLTGRELRE